MIYSAETNAPVPYSIPAKVSAKLRNLERQIAAAEDGRPVPTHLGVEGVPMCPAGADLVRSGEPTSGDPESVTCGACLADPLVPQIRAALARR